MNIIVDLFQLALQHRIEHDCSAYPYENGQKLIDTVLKFDTKSILEIGTGIGYTSAIMALQNPEITVETIEKDPEHTKLAEQFLLEQNVAKQVSVINEQAEIYLQTISKQYDLIFFDGYQIHYEFLPHYNRLLKTGGILYLANNHLKSKTSDQFFKELLNDGKENNHWRMLEQFADTTIAQKILR